ncbi:MAG: PDZ domain-containing protein [Myxococcales bacterium]|nr:PDZ domain-containing protein [Myxococcales bacterium]
MNAPTVVALLALGAIGCSTAADEIGGVHARFGWSTEGLFVRGVPEDGPAGLAGLEAGDQVVTIDGENVEGLPEDAVVQKLRGRVGSLVSLEIRRRGERALRSVTVERVAYDRTLAR